MSMTTAHSTQGYSANVQLRAHFDGQMHRLSHVGPNEIIFIEPLAINPGLITVDILIDNDLRTYHAQVATSFSGGATRVPVTFINTNGSCPGSKPYATPSACK